jgi:hypothetical protein
MAFVPLGLDLRTGLRFMDRTYPLEDELLGEVTSHMPIAKSAQRRRFGLAIARADRASTVKAADIRIGVDRAPWLAL